MGRRVAAEVGRLTLPMRRQTPNAHFPTTAQELRAPFEHHSLYERRHSYCRTVPIVSKLEGYERHYNSAFP